MKITTRVIFLVFFYLSSSYLFSQVHSNVFTGCASDQLLYGNTKALNDQQTLDLQAYQFFLSNNKHKNASSAVMVPTVVHIVHYGGAENISNAQVIAAINNINSKYLSNNNFQVQLCLAQRDPFNNPTTGITRDSSLFTNDTMETTDLSLKDVNRWNPYCYLNIWIVKEISSISMGNGVIGYATFPSSHGQNTDGLVIEAGYFGTSSINDCVGAHELGHYLGLYHTFQNACTNNNCLLDGDQVCDTPPDQTTFASCNPAANSCNTDANDPSANNPFTSDVADLGDDYMDYSSLTCYSQFTPGQYDRMQYFLTNVRNSLLGCLSCTSPCPTPVTATITSPGANINVNVGTSVSFSSTATNSTSYQWYLTSGNTLSTTTSLTYTFNAVGTYWIKFEALSGDTSLCLDGIDSVEVNVMQPPVTSCGGSLEFLHTNDGVLLPTPAAGQHYHNNNGFTWECWVKLTTPFSSYSGALLRNMICSVDPVVYDDICLSFGWSGGVGNVPITSLCFKVDGQNGPNSASCTYVPSGGFQLGTWYHVAATMDYVNHTAKLYLNGTLVNTKANPATPFNRAIPTQLSWDVAVNPGYPNPPLGGNLDEVRIWSTVRTPAQIAADYNHCLSGSESNLMLYYRCDQSAGSLSTDASSNGNNGTLTHQTAWSTQQCPVSGANCSAGCSGTCPAIKASNDTTICSGSSAQLIASSGFLSYSWIPSTGLNNGGIANPVASPAATTTYVVMGSSTDATGLACTSMDTVVVRVVSPLAHTLDLGPDRTLCNNGTQTFDAGNGFVHYQWSDGNISHTMTAYGPGKYWVTVTDSCGATQTDTVQIVLTPALTINLHPDTLICLGTGLQLSFTSSLPIASFKWSPGTALSCTVCANPVASPNTSIDYILVGTTAQGCTSSDSIHIAVDENVPVNVLYHVKNTTCTQNNGWIQVNGVIGGTPDYEFDLNGTGFSNDTLFSNLLAGSYTLTARDTQGCMVRTTMLVPDEAGPSNIIVLTSAASVCEASGGAMIASVAGGTSPYLYSLNGSAFMDSVLYPGLSAGTHTFVVKDSNNCIHTSPFTIQLIPEDESVHIPNYFSPNDDSINPAWFIKGNCIKELSCKIYDRWGIEMASISDINETWDGTHAGRPVPDGVYYYVTHIVFTSGKSYNHAGHIQVIR